MKRRIILIAACLFTLSACGVKEKDVKPATSTKQTIEHNDSFKVESLKPGLKVNVASGLLTMSYSIKNGNTVPANISFPTAQQIEFTISSEDGTIVYQSSKDGAFSNIETNSDILANQTKTWEEQVNLSTRNLQYGKFKVQAELVANKINDEKVVSPSQALSDEFSYEKVKVSPTKQTDIQVTGENGLYHVKGTFVKIGHKAYYTVEDGHNNLIDETLLPIKSKDGSVANLDFDIKIPKSDLPKNGVVSLVIYEKDSDDQISNSVDTTLQDFQ
ncbi:hypothetical protein J5Y03_05170 [Bacillus sp. RG28]|uniref:Intracellular proteinase inhibitor BsuPI domain-containing protein n=1 Tax=Gottfriedia endophytica TaxID=2820819 RepID=A0A940SG10_9BACI|nr:BsuPI-related putative proteinase inhibitor [Gottfriedia endophytica]MBP0724577.1 hypothetical protein [Gottfriedia endophytica]